MKTLLSLAVMGLLLLSFSAEAGWQKLWNEPVSLVVANHDQYANTTDLFAVKKSTKEVYEYNGAPNDWLRIGTPSKMYALPEDFSKLIQVELVFCLYRPARLLETDRRASR
jgi:hypothetical protein